MPKGWIQEKNEMEKLLNEVEFGFLGMIQGVKPYVIPMTFAYQEDKIYLHAALRGLKLDCIRENPQVCFTVAQQELVPNSDPCKFSIRYRSVVAQGQAKVLKDIDEKLKALNIIASKFFKGRIAPAVASEKAQSVAVVVIEIKEITGKYNIA
jgi:nitroimidazol reductase NimA-like FMN-containing flavoprotein (pyridoxamine 5'-phosphate oxidase superfamily)